MIKSPWKVNLRIACTGSFHTIGLRIIIQILVGMRSLRAGPFCGGWNQVLEFIDGYLCIRRVGCMMDYLFAHYEWKGTDGITWNSTAHKITDEYHVNIGCL